MKGIDSASSMQKVMKSIATGSSYAELMKGIDSASSIQKVMKSIAAGSSYAELMKGINSANLIDKWIISLPQNSAFYGAIARLSLTECFDNLLAEADKDPSGQLTKIETSWAAREIHDADGLLQELASTEDPDKISKTFGKLPEWLKWFLVYFVPLLIYQIAVGATGGVVGNLITPYVEEYLSEARGATQREQTNALRKLSLSELELELSGYRFITATTLNLRANPNARAPILGELRFGQVVRVLSYGLDWTEVLYEYGDGKTITGWVFTRYTEKFRS